MREVNIAEADVAAVAKRIKDFSSHIPSTGVSADTRPSAIKVIDCVLSLRTSYDKVVVPRLETFMSAHPCVQQVSELADLMASYPTPYEFIQQELDYNSEWKARILQSVVRYVCKIVEEESTASEEEVLQQWATRSKPQECYILKIKGFKLAGFQYLRMLFGADTAKPDVHIIRFLSDTLNRGVSDIGHFSFWKQPRNVWGSLSEPLTVSSGKEGREGDKIPLVQTLFGLIQMLPPLSPPKKLLMKLCGLY